MPATPITALTDRRILNRIVDMRINPYTALYNMLFPPSVRENLYEEFVQIDVDQDSTLTMAPFVKVGTKAVIMNRGNGTSYTIETPFINIKRPMTYSTKLAKRIIGGNVFSNDRGQILQIIRNEITKDVDVLNKLVDNRLEWMAAMMFTGTVSYESEGGDSFTIATGKAAGSAVSHLWSVTDSSDVILEDIRDAKATVSAARGPIPDTAVCGSQAAAALRARIMAGRLKLDTTSGIDIGHANMLSNIEQNGMIYIGRIANVDFWEYLGTYVADTTGVVTPLIRINAVEYFSMAPAAVASRKMWFGLIPDLKAILEGNAVTERYLTSKAPDEDQGTYEGILKTRPFPWFFRPDWMVTQLVTAG